MKITRWFILGILALINFTHIIDSMLIMPIGDIFIDIFNLEAFEYTILVSAYAVGAVISSFYAILYVDVFDRKKALMIAYGGFGLGTFLCAFADSYLFLVSIRFLTGLFGGVLGTLVLSIVSDLFLFKERGRAMGILFGAFSAASALGIPFGIYLAAKGNWQLPFLIIGIASIGVSILIATLFPSMTAHLKEVKKDRRPMSVIRDVLGDQNQRNALMGGFILIIGHFFIIPFISPYLIKNVGLTQIEISYQFFFGGIATIVSAPIVGRLVDKYGVMKIFVVMMTLCCIPTILISHMGSSSVVYAISITTLFFITASGRMIPANTLITAAAPTANRGSFMSFKSLFQQLAIVIVSLISGMIVYIDESSDLYVNYSIVGYLSIIVSFMTIYFLNRIKIAKGN